MNTTPGTSPLNPKQQDELALIFGKRYVTVASHPNGMSSRRQRRAAVKASKRRNDGWSKVRA